MHTGIANSMTWTWKLENLLQQDQAQATKEHHYSFVAFEGIKLNGTLHSLSFQQEAGVAEACCLQDLNHHNIVQEPGQHDQAQWP